MDLQRGFERPAKYRGGIVSIGNFDGVHRGHQKMIAALVAEARGEGVSAVVFTFDPHPINILRPGQAPPCLSTLERKAGLLAAAGVDCTIAYPTDHDLLQLSPRQFFEQIVRGELDARGLVEGPNFRFGRNRSGDVDTLRGLCEEAGLSLTVVEPVRVGGRMVSSSAVRSLISDGRLGEAVELLGHPYRITGRVVRGAERGASIGFPTANLENMATLLPADGVYAGAAVCEGRRFPAAVHLGPNVTFGESERKLEIHLIDYAGDLYDRELSIDLYDRVRDTARFESPAALRRQLEADIETVRGMTNVQ